MFLNRASETPDEQEAQQIQTRMLYLLWYIALFEDSLQRGLGETPESVNRTITPTLNDLVQPRTQTGSQYDISQRSRQKDNPDPRTKNYNVYWAYWNLDYDAEPGECDCIDHHEAGCPPKATTEGVSATGYYDGYYIGYNFGYGFDHDFRYDPDYDSGYDSSCDIVYDHPNYPYRYVPDWENSEYTYTSSLDRDAMDLWQLGYFIPNSESQSSTLARMSLLWIYILLIISACLPFLFWPFYHEWPNDGQRMSPCQWPYNLPVPIAVLWGVCWMFGIYESSEDHTSSQLYFDFDLYDFGGSTPSTQSHQLPVIDETGPFDIDFLFRSGVWNAPLDSMKTGYDFSGDNGNLVLAAVPTCLHTPESSDTGASEIQIKIPVSREPEIGFQEQHSASPFRIEGGQVRQDYSSLTSKTHSPQPRAINDKLTPHPITPTNQKKRKTRSKQEYVCDTHNFRTSSERLFGEHMWEEDQIKYFRCEDCEFQTARQDNLVVHRRNCKEKKRKDKQLKEARTAKGNKKRVSVLNLKDHSGPRSSTPLPSEAPESLNAAHNLALPPSTPTVSLQDPQEQCSTSQPQAPEWQQPELVTLSHDGLSHQIPHPHEFSKFYELVAKIATLEQENSALKQENSTLRVENQALRATQDKLAEIQEELEQTRGDRDVWHEQCRTLRKAARKRQGADT